MENRRAAPGRIENSAERVAVAAHLGQLLVDWGAGTIDSVGPQIQARVAALSEASFRELLERVQHTGSDWGYFPGHELARQLSRDTMERVLLPGSRLEGAELLDDVAGCPLIFAGNHLSFVDVNVFDALLAADGRSDTAERITSLVGPKVFSVPIRKVASLCFGCIKIPQSQAIASEEAVMSPREVARVAARTVEVARERVAAGDHLLVFAEGSRSRTASMNRLRPAASRYFEVGETMLVPWGHTGTEKLVPIGEDHAYPTRVSVRVGRPVSTSRILELCQSKRPLVADAVGFLIAETLPESYRGAYGPGDPSLDEARQIAADLLR